MQQQTQHFIANKTEALSHFLADKILPTTDFHFLLNFGAIYINKKRCTADVLLNKNDYIRVHNKPKRYGTVNCSNILFENDSYLFVAKPAGCPSHAMLDNQIENVKYFYEKQLNKKLWTTYRLDIPTAGILCLAKSSTAAREFNFQLQQNKVLKYYTCLTSSPVKQGPMLHYMKNSQGIPKVVSPTSTDDASSLACSLEVLSCQYVPKANFWGFSLQNVYKIDIRLITGRTHQIRAQLSHEGAPIYFDKMYGHDSHCSSDNIALVCNTIEFIHNKCVLRVELPNSFCLFSPDPLG